MGRAGGRARLLYNAPVRTLTRLGSALALTALFAFPAYAEGVSGQVSLLSNYVWRGISESNGNPALQGSVTAVGPVGLYAQGFISSLDYQGAHERADFTGGIRDMTPVGLGFNVGATAYRFDVSSLNFEETFLRLRFGPLLGGVYHDWQHGNTYLEAGYRVGLGSGLHLLLHAGHTSGRTVASYDDYGLGVTKSWNGFTAGVFVTATDHHVLSGMHNATVALALTQAW